MLYSKNTWVKLVYTYLFLILCVKFHVACMQTRFSWSFMHCLVEGSAMLLKYKMYFILYLLYIHIVCVYNLEFCNIICLISVVV
jgi:hypothetical protein